ncbi:MAG: HAMP domain-containing histidine kinase [Defluviitaleaceae bacterium]|nr:HAMP domain-containing histidine kinase [Defluviitaleaceae bacterium]
MWNRISLRARIVFLTVLSLILTVAFLTYFFNLNVTHNVMIPAVYYLGDIEIEPRFDVMPEEIEFEIILPLQEVEEIEIFFLDSGSRNRFMAFSIIIACAVVLVGAFMAYFIANSFNNMHTKLNLSFEREKLFAQNVAHELRTPLASILTNVEVLQMEEKPSFEEYKDVIDTVKSNTEHLIKLVNGLLSINAVAEETDWQKFSGRDVFKKIISELDAEIKKNNLTIKIIGDCTIMGDEVLLTRACLNLVHNAVRYNKNGGFVNISLSDKNIVIEDSGIGIPDGDLENIFEPLYCVDKSNSKAFGGHGLGLAIAKSIFEKNKIKIHITSSLGVGTKIFLNLSKY